MPKTKIFIIAGEVSGDLHGSNLLKELKSNSIIKESISLFKK